MQKWPSNSKLTYYKVGGIYRRLLKLAQGGKLTPNQMVMVFQKHVGGLLNHTITQMRLRHSNPVLILETVSAVTKLHPEVWIMFEFGFQEE